MRYGNDANAKAQLKAVRLIGPRGCVARRGKIYLVGEIVGAVEFKAHGASDKSWRRAFDNAGLFDPQQPKHSRI